MTFVRSVFIFAIVMLVVGMVASRMMLQSIFGPSGAAVATVSVAQGTTPTSETHRQATATAPARHVETKAGLSHSAPRRRLAVAVYRTARLPKNRPAKHSSVPSTPTPVPSPTAGTVSLARYWVNQTAVRHGNTVALGYVIDNQTGHTMRVMLGASLKSSHALSWAEQSLSDPAHDVVAIVPPGVSTHTRFFKLPAHLHPGVYDVAWGLRNASSGHRAGLVAAPSALSVVR